MEAEQCTAVSSAMQEAELGFRSTRTASTPQSFGRRLVCSIVQGGISSLCAAAQYAAAQKSTCTPPAWSRQSSALCNLI